jgi:hypothetical protein
VELSGAQDRIATKVRFCVQDSWAGILRRGFGGEATSSRENWPPHTLQAQAMTLTETAFAAVCGFHFLDSSPPHSGQITLRSFYRV